MGEGLERVHEETAQVQGSELRVTDTHHHTSSLSTPLIHTQGPRTHTAQHGAHPLQVAAGCRAPIEPDEGLQQRLLATHSLSRPPSSQLSAAWMTQLRVLQEWPHRLMLMW